MQKMDGSGVPDLNCPAEVRVLEGAAPRPLGSPASLDAEVIDSSTGVTNSGSGLATTPSISGPESEPVSGEKMSLGSDDDASAEVMEMTFTQE